MPSRWVALDLRGLGVASFSVRVWRPSRVVSLIVALAMVPSCSGKRAPLSSSTTTMERSFYDDCTTAEGNITRWPPGERSLYCACGARIFVERAPADMVAKNELSADEVAGLREIGAEAGRVCDRVTAATRDSCRTRLVAAPPADRPAACDCFLSGLVEEFSPAELVALSRQATSEVPNAAARSEAIAGRCATRASSGSDDAVLALSIATAILSAGAVAMGIVSATSTPDPTYIFLPSN